jgi:hypothetical protein
MYWSQRSVQRTDIVVVIELGRTNARVARIIIEDMLVLDFATVRLSIGGPHDVYLAIANTPLFLAEISIQLLLHFTLPPRYCACVAGAAGLNDDILEAFLEPVEADKHYSTVDEDWCAQAG